jgi:hypothetical protein
MNRPTCARCHGDSVLRRQITSNGSQLIAWYCLACDWWAEQPITWLPHTPLRAQLAKRGKCLEDVPLVEKAATQLSLLP